MLSVCFNVDVCNVCYLGLTLMLVMDVISFQFRCLSWLLFVFRTSMFVMILICVITSMCVMTVIGFQVLHIDVCIGRHLFEFRDLHNACYLFLISIVVMNVIGVHVRCFIWRRCLARSRALIWGRHTTLPQQQRPNPSRCATWCREVEATACLIPQNAFAIFNS